MWGNYEEYIGHDVIFYIHEEIVKKMLENIYGDAISDVYEENVCCDAISNMREEDMK